MKFIRILMFALFLVPGVSRAASNEFMVAAQLLAAAKNADIQQVQSLVNAGADVNFVDSTGLSIVCTALMNNDVRAAQILQMYGADASKCDSQIKRYNNRTKPKPNGGLFSGLSSAQTIGLAAAGAAVVVGGLFLLTDVFDPGNDNDSSASGGNRPDNNPDSGGGVNGNAAFSVAYSPAYLGADGKMTTDDSVYQENLASWNPAAGGLRAADFNYFNPNEQPENNYYVDGVGVQMQNYLLMMHGYSAFANDYYGQTVFRDKSNNNNPVLVSNNAGGGAPVAVGLVTANGLNPAGSADRAGGIEYANSAAADATTYLVDKYLNFANPNAEFDFSGSGTAMNPFASPYDNALGKIVAGWEAGGRSYGDLMGFVPNSRLAIYKTGGGDAFVDVANPTDGAPVATLTDEDENSALGVGDKIVMGGITYNIVSARGDATVTNPTIKIGSTTYRLADDSQMLLAKCSGDACDGVSDVAIYQGIDGYYYLNTTGGNAPDAVYVLKDNNFYKQKELQNTDYKNFEALDAARSSGVNVLANVSIIDASRANDYKSVADMPAYVATSSLADTEDYQNLIDKYYGADQGASANRMFNAYGASSPVLVMPAGEFIFDNNAAKTATFENYAPLLYDTNLNQRFMTVVAVGHSKGTGAADSIEAYGNGVGENYGPLYLSMYKKDDVSYMSRTCGVAGVGGGNVDPWCFAAAGPTTEMAAASAAGAFASLQAAFDYMSNAQIYQLMALTADGYLLGTASDGTAFTKDTLATYLKQMYELPPEYKYNIGTMSSEQYLNAFAQVYGYGLINLERAMKPGRSVYFYDGATNKIVSANGNAYWRAASNTMFRPSAALNMRAASISAPFFDVVQSVDGKMTLPRVWENEFAVGATDSHGLYMGDVLGDLSVRRESAPTTKIGNLDFSIDVSERAYVDNMSGLDSLNIGYKNGNWGFGASYQRYLTDGASRFAGLHNPIMGLASNAVVSDVEYNYGKWSFGGRAFSGMISDEGLLENDPTVSAQYMPAKLGLVQGGGADIKWVGDTISFKSSIGTVTESDTLLGAYTDGLLNLGNGNTTYVDFESKYNVSDSVNFTARATFAHTVSDAVGGIVLGLSDIESNSFAFGANIGNFEFSVSQPLAITDGALKYSYAKYDVDATGAVNVVDAHIENLSLKPDVRETRFMATYRHNFGEFTDGAVGFIYRVNPNHTDDFGNESVFMMKLSHRLGI